MADPHPLDVLQPGQQLLWYRIGRVLGRGSFGITYLAEDINLQRPVAIKEFFPSQYCSRVSGSATITPISEESARHFKWAMQRFMSEARTLARFEHPNIVRVLNVFAENDTAYMVMHYEHGTSLSDMLKQHGTLDEAQLTDITVPLLDGLQKIHASGFIHRDIKPSNLYIRDNGSPVLLDFGSARQSIKEHTQSLTSMVSPGYAPIEQYTSDGERQGPWTDIYGLGATLYRAITGNTPPTAVDRCEALAQGGADSIRDSLEQSEHAYSDSFLNAVAHALAFRVEDRPQNVAAWRQEFNFDIEAGERTDSTETSTRTLPLGDQEDGEVTLNLSDNQAETGFENQSAADEDEAPADQLAGADDDSSYAPTQVMSATELPDIYNESQQEQVQPLYIRPQSDNNEARPAETDDLPRISAMESTAEDAATAAATDYDDSWYPQPHRRGFRFYTGISMLAVVAGIALAVLLEAGSLAGMADAVRNRLQQSDSTASTSTIADNTDQQFMQNQPAQELPGAARQTDKASDAHTYDLDEFVKLPEQQKPQEPEQEQQLQREVTSRTAGQPATDNTDSNAPPAKQTAAAANAVNIEKLLAAAKADVRARRLTTPADNNAFDKYRKVLEHDPDNQAAQAGLNKILELYLMIARNSLAQGRLEHAETMLSRAEQVKPNSSRLMQARMQIEKQRRQNQSDTSFRRTNHRPASPPL